MRGFSTVAFGMVLAAMVWTAATALATVSVGTGPDSANVGVFFKDGVYVEFNVAFSGSTTGINLIKTIDAELTDFSALISDFGWGEFVDGLTWQNSSNIGYGGGDDWWHYWEKNAGQTSWTESVTGALGRVVNAGDADLWVYGYAQPITQLPQPVPGDLNGDNLANNQDIAAFVLALTDPTAYAQAYPSINLLAVGDINGDQSFNNQDIAPFVSLLTGQGNQLGINEQTALNAIPEPASLGMLAIGGLMLLRRVRRVG